MTKFMADGTGRWALWDNAGNNDAPFTNPRASLPLIHAHSDFDYLQWPSSDPTITTSVSIPVTVASRRRTIDLGAHGKPGIPFVFGQVLLSGSWVPLVGSIPVHRGALVIGGYWAGAVINWTLALSATNIYLAEVRSLPTFNASLPASRSVRIWVSNNIMA